MIFKKITGEVINDPKKYVLDYLNEKPEVLLFIGTDSKRRKKRYIYISTICFRIPNNGVHYIYASKTYSMNEINGIFMKLWKEVELTVELLNYLTEFIPKEKITVDLDYNVIKKYESNKVHDSAMGWVKSLGVNVRTKPNAWAASYAADYLSNKK